jgi:hypothetical protein
MLIFVIDLSFGLGMAARNPRKLCNSVTRLL